jgi:hypothetical protein
LIFEISRSRGNYPGPNQVFQLPFNLDLAASCIFSVSHLVPTWCRGERKEREEKERKTYLIILADEERTRAPSEVLCAFARHLHEAHAVAVGSVEMVIVPLVGVEVSIRCRLVGRHGREWLVFVGVLDVSLERLWMAYRALVRVPVGVALKGGEARAELIVLGLQRSELGSLLKWPGKLARVSMYLTTDRMPAS